MTALEQLEITLLGIVSFDSEELRTKYKERIAQAKEKEKEQTILFLKSIFQQDGFDYEKAYNKFFNKS